MNFGSDFVLDIVCYRRHGHNETDEPAFTQPIMYRAIRDRKTTRALYAEQLVREGVIAADEAKAMWDGFSATLEAAYQAAQSFKPNKADWLEGHWTGLSAPTTRGRMDRWRHRGRAGRVAAGRAGAGHGAGRVRRQSRRSPASSRPSGR